MQEPGKPSKTPARATEQPGEPQPGQFSEEEIPFAIERAMQRGVRKALRIHKALGNPIAVWEDGKVVWIPPEKIVVEDD